MRFLIRNTLFAVLAAGLVAFAYSADSNHRDGSFDAVLWGANGHRITAEVAERHLTENARAAIDALIGDTSLAQISTWPDEIRSNPAWGYVAPWHFITVDDNLARFPNGQERYEAASAGSRGNIIEAMKYFETVLKQPGDAATRAIALKFLVHFVGDVHQPLHVGRGGDLGGNRVIVHWFGELRNLHSIWDSGLIESEDLSYTEFADFIDHVPEATAAAWQQSTCIDWMDESFALRDQVYGLEDLSRHTDREGRLDLNYTYAYQVMPTLKQRLAQGGIRLAGVLNAIFDENPHGTTCDLPFIKETVRLRGE